MHYLEDDDTPHRRHGELRYHVRPGDSFKMAVLMANRMSLEHGRQSVAMRFTNEPAFDHTGRSQTPPDLLFNGLSQLSAALILDYLGRLRIEMGLQTIAHRVTPTAGEDPFTDMGASRNFNSAALEANRVSFSTDKPVIFSHPKVPLMVVEAYDTPASLKAARERLTINARHMMGHWKHKLDEFRHSRL